MLETAHLLSFSIFAFVAAFTPGPNNVMLAASGANFGLRRTLPHIFGICAGFLCMVVAASFGLTSMFSALPQLLILFKIAGGIFIVYLAWKIATAAPQQDKPQVSQPLSFTAAALFQLINPKAVIVIISAISTYASASASPLHATILITSIFAIVTILSTLLWGYAGEILGRVLKQRNHLRIFNAAMACLLLVTLLPVITDNLFG